MKVRLPVPSRSPSLVTLNHSDWLDPVDRTNDRTVIVHDFGGPGDIPGIGFKVRLAPPDPETEPSS